MKSIFLLIINCLKDDCISHFESKTVLYFGHSADCNLDERIFLCQEEGIFTIHFNETFLTGEFSRGENQINAARFKAALFLLRNHPQIFPKLLLKYISSVP